MPVEDFRMFDPEHGWAWGELGDDDHIWTTDDGGSTWEDVTPYKMTVWPREFGFLDPLNAWVPVTDLPDDSYGLARTSDGGETWTMVNDSTFCASGCNFKFFNEREGIMSEFDVGAGTAFHMFYETQDGGATWSPFEFISGHMLYSLGNWPGEYTTCNICGDALYLDMDRVIVIDGTLACCEAESTTLWITLDRGQVWTQYELMLPPGRFNSSMIDPVAPTFHGKNRAILPVHLDAYEGEDRYSAVAFYATTDGGLTWTFRSLFEEGDRYPKIASDEDVFMRCGSELCVTHDGARTWQRISSNLNFDSNLEGGPYAWRYDFVDSETGWAFWGRHDGESTFWRTTDGGESWTIIEPVFLQ